MRWWRLIGSTILLLFVVVMWIRSYGRTDYPQAQVFAGGVGAYSTAGGVRLSIYIFGANPEYQLRWITIARDGYPRRSDTAGGIAATLGFGVDAGGGGRWHYWGLTLPYWFITLTAIALTIWFIRRRRDIPPGVCRHCGYDLRATSENDGPLLDRCPECGTSSAPIAETATVRA